MDWSNDENNAMLARALAHYENRRLPRELYHLVECSAKEIRLKHLRALFRLRDTCTLNVLRDELEDVFYPTQVWPEYALRILMMEQLGYANRLSLATFLHGNGLRDQDLAARLIRHYNRQYQRDNDWEKRIGKFQSLFQFLEGAADIGHPSYFIMSQNYWYYSINVGRTVFYNGNTRMRPN